MSIKFLETTFAMRPAPAQPVASEIALEAGVTEFLAQAYIAAAWEQAENFCGRTWRGYGSGEILIEVDFPHEYRIPRYPYPASVTAEIWSDNARAYGYAEVRYRSGYVELYPGQLYRLLWPRLILFRPRLTLSRRWRTSPYISLSSFPSGASSRARPKATRP